MSAPSQPAPDWPASFRALVDDVRASGCVHEFWVVGVVARSTLFPCHRCGVAATAGEIAWMLYGGQVIHDGHIENARAHERLAILASLPVQGGMQ